ncbi:bifunctional glycosyltransferase/CDP-glycerol:glycerophosphate glycerophosphotransferase [Peterkaempfera griseoplana]|uniref:bifunctional glycosyltransferase/CDP-glycerol:glycerophosphate glycerophosphotransferase n=1 Tax=Peterkaempfera griseoplana TaxID=66896 RepID=UPI0006E1E7B2|nr:CDP-glycerol glycerophosphotransferase family protein [Peterkaempfera griseoplana]
MAEARTPDVSVTIIVYNDEERLPRAVRSVLDQTLHNLEVVIADDCSTDGTERVARRLAASDPRVRYERLERNSGGCSAPRNRGIEVSRAPYLMFLDSDDELPRHACKSMLLVAEETGVDFVTGEVTRLFEETGRTGLWYPQLFAEYRVVNGLRERPEYFTDHLSTNKLYRADFIARHGLRFPEGIHYEDQLFSAQAYTSAESFAVVPWEIYTWRLAPESDSISSSRHKIQNVIDRIAVARLIDAYLAEAGHADLQPAKDHKFLSHDIRLYLGDLPFRDPAWREGFTEAVGPYLDRIPDEVYARLARDERVCLHLLRSGRAEDATAAARVLGRPQVGPRHAVTEGDRTWWGTEVPQDEIGRRELDITEWHLRDHVFATSRIRHELESVQPAGPDLRLRIRTYDPAGLVGDGTEAVLKLATSGDPLEIPLQLTPDRPGEYLSEAALDVRAVPVPLVGFSGRRHPLVSLERDGERRSDVLLAPQDLPVRRAEVTYHEVGAHTVTLRPEGRGAGRLEVEWQRTGVLRAAEPLGPHLRTVKRKAGRVKRIVSGHQGKATVFDAFTKLPGKRELVLFEAMEGRGYADNPRYVYEELMRRDLPLDVVWSHSGDTSSFPAGIPLVRRGSWEYVRLLARARYWVDSHNLPQIYRKPEGTRYLQTWHGQTMKTMGFDVPALRMAAPEVQQRHRESVARWDMLVCPSAEFERTFVPANEYTGELVRSGYPRNDVLVRREEPEQLELAARVRERLKIPDGRRMLLYAPTFRDAARNSGRSIRVDFQALVEELGEDWVIVVRAHYYDRFTVPPQLGHVLRDGSGFADVNDLVLASDALLTDYSSLMFDYANTGRPILLYTDDYEAYRTSERGTYYDLEQIAPGPMLSTTGELAEALRDLEGTAGRYADRYARFQEMFCSYETGQASKLVVDAFFEGGSDE